MIAGAKPPNPAHALEATRFFALAYGFLLLGALFLLLNSPQLAAGQFTATSIVAGLHFITLGFLSLSIFGALQVFLGVALGEQPSIPKLAPWIRSLWSLGVLLFPVGLIYQSVFTVVLGVSLLGLGILLLTVQVAMPLLQSKRGHLTRGYVFISLASLWVTWALGGLAALSRTGITLAPLPSGYFTSHILIAVFGWVGAMIVGVGSHLVPMFALSKPTTQWPVKMALPLFASLPLLGVVAAFTPFPWTMVSWSAAALGSLLWITQFALFLTRRIRKERDLGLIIALVSNLFLILGWAMLPFTSAPLVSGFLFVVGWLTLFTLGIYHRIIPFLAWFKLFRSAIGKERPPQVKDLLDERLTLGTASLTPAGVLLMSLGLGLSSIPTTYAGSTLLLLGVLCGLGQIHFLKGRRSNASISFQSSNKGL